MLQSVAAVCHADCGCDCRSAASGTVAVMRYSPRRRPSADGDDAPDGGAVGAHHLQRQAVQLVQAGRHLLQQQALNGDDALHPGCMTYGSPHSRQCNFLIGAHTAPNPGRGESEGRLQADEPAGGGAAHHTPTESQGLLCSHILTRDGCSAAPPQQPALQSSSDAHAPAFRVLADVDLQSIGTTTGLDRSEPQCQSHRGAPPAQDDVVRSR